MVIACIVTFILSVASFIMYKRNKQTVDIIGTIIYGVISIMMLILSFR